MDDLLLSEVQVIVKNREQTKKYTVGIYWEVYFRKTKGIIKILLKKKKKEKKNTEPSVLRKIESKHANVVTQNFLLVIFSKQWTKQ